MPCRPDICNWLANEPGIRAADANAGTERRRNSETPAPRPRAMGAVSGSLELHETRPVTTPNPKATAARPTESTRSHLGHHRVSCANSENEKPAPPTEADSALVILANSTATSTAHKKHRKVSANAGK